MSERPGRSVAEWTTFVVSSLLVLLLLGLIASQSYQSDSPPAPEARVAGPMEERGGQFLVPVTVTNTGDEAAEAVQVLVSLDIDGEVTEGDQTVDFLSGDDEAELVFVFDDDPADGDLTVQVTGFAVP